MDNLLVGAHVGTELGKLLISDTMGINPKMWTDAQEEEEPDIIVVSDIPDMPDFFGQSTVYGVELVYVPIIGATLAYQGKEYEVLQTATYRNELEEVSHIMTCRDIDPNGDKDPIELYSDTKGITVS